jgi:signal transduction histidine kinase
MKNSLTGKLTLSFVLIALTTAALVAVFVRVTSENRLSRLIVDQQRSSLQTNLSDFYTKYQSWDGISNYLRGLTFQNSNPPPENPNNPTSPNGAIDRRSLFALADARGVIVIASLPNYPQGRFVDPQTLKSGEAVLVNGQQVGTILTEQRNPAFNPPESLFLQRTNEALLYAIGVALIVALAMGFFLARTLIKPLRALTEAAHRIAEGNLTQEVKVKSKDEIGQLARAFNRMSQEVAHVNQLRRQMTADIAHDLRTPLTVISGYIESMRDGVLAPTTQRFDLISTEIDRLQDLVDDLRMLSLADSGELSFHPQRISPKELIERTATLFQQRTEEQGLTIKIETTGPLPDVYLDEARMMQVFGNLLTNALQYTAKGGEVRLSAGLKANSIRFSVKDTGTGIAPGDLPHIFNRFYRADKSRSEEVGGSGLGLAIAKALVEAQGGVITAVSTLGQGTEILMDFPVFNEKQDHPNNSAGKVSNL